MVVELRPSGPLMVNTYYCVDEENGVAFIVDPGGFDEGLAEKIVKSGVSLEYIVLTHGHGDHIGGIKEYMERFPDTKVICSEAERELLTNPALNYSRETFGIPFGIEPDIMVRDGDVLKLGSIDLEFIMTPGHTVGGMCILVGDILFSGDTLFRASIGRTDFHGGSFKQIAESIKGKLFSLPDDTRVLPGHMGETTIGYEKKNNPFV